VNSRKGCAGHAAGWAVFIARISRSALRYKQCSIGDLKEQNKAYHVRTYPELHDGIPGSQLVIIEGADHALIWTHLDELMRATDEFLGS